ncbi:MAG TPA: TadE/TadG family type IV pilus assembly protein [Rhizomicrobium sp.]|jgi:Flp pilus assembly protein TadG|nr:TadE/TadG family type IV pilus assembly protein [Rhizomicrobium sp.]
MAAVEFALISPVLLLLFFGTVELTRAFGARAQVLETASTAADLVAQAGALSSSDISNVFTAATAILYPYYDPGSGVSYKEIKPRIIVASVIDNNDTSFMTGKVQWSCGFNNTGSGGSEIDNSLDAGKIVDFNGQPLMTSGGSVIVAKVVYSYVSPTTQILTGPTLMTNTFYLQPRRVAQIPAPASCPT